jgi:hypothetical protein
MSLGNTVLQLFCCFYLWCLYRCAVSKTKNFCYYYYYCYYCDYYCEYLLLLLYCVSIIDQLLL